LQPLVCYPLQECSLAIEILVQLSSPFLSPESRVQVLYCPKLPDYQIENKTCGLMTKKNSPTDG